MKKQRSTKITWRRHLTLALLVLLLAVLVGMPHRPIAFASAQSDTAEPAIPTESSDDNTTGFPMAFHPKMNAGFETFAGIVATATGVASLVAAGAPIDVMADLQSVAALAYFSECQFFNFSSAFGAEAGTQQESGGETDRVDVIRNTTTVIIGNQTVNVTNITYIYYNTTTVFVVDGGGWLNLTGDTYKMLALIGNATSTALLPAAFLLPRGTPYGRLAGSLVALCCFVALQLAVGFVLAKQHIQHLRVQQLDDHDDDHNEDEARAFASGRPQRAAAGTNERVDRKQRRVAVPSLVPLMLRMARVPSLTFRALVFLFLGLMLEATTLVLLLAPTPTDRDTDSGVGGGNESATGSPVAAAQNTNTKVVPAFAYAVCLVGGTTMLRLWLIRVKNNPLLRFRYYPPLGGRDDVLSQATTAVKNNTPLAKKRSPQASSFFSPVTYSRVASSSFARRLTVAVGFWLPLSLRDRFGSLFECYKPARLYWWMFTIARSCVTTLCLVLPLRARCRFSIYALLCNPALSLVGLALLRPYTSNVCLVFNMATAFLSLLIHTFPLFSATSSSSGSSSTGGSTELTRGVRYMEAALFWLLTITALHLLVSAVLLRSFDQRWTELVLGSGFALRRVKPAAQTRGGTFVGAGNTVARAMQLKRAQGENGADPHGESENDDDGDEEEDEALSSSSSYTASTASMSTNNSDGSNTVSKDKEDDEEGSTSAVIEQVDGYISEEAMHALISPLLVSSSKSEDRNRCRDDDNTNAKPVRLLAVVPRSFEQAQYAHKRYARRDAFTDTWLCAQRQAGLPRPTTVAVSSLNAPRKDGDTHSGIVVHNPLRAQSDLGEEEEEEQGYLI